MVVHRAGPGSAPQLAVIRQGWCLCRCSRNRTGTYGGKAFVPAATVGSLHIRRPRFRERERNLIAAPQPFAAVQAPQVGELHADRWSGDNFQLGGSESDSRKAGDLSLAE